MPFIHFNNHYRSFNILSVILIILSLIFLIFKGLNYGVDFKGGTLIEIRVSNNNTDISDSNQNSNLSEVYREIEEIKGNIKQFNMKINNKI